MKARLRSRIFSGNRLPLRAYVYVFGVEVLTVLVCLLVLPGKNGFAIGPQYPAWCLVAVFTGVHFVRLRIPLGKGENQEMVLGEPFFLVALAAHSAGVVALCFAVGYLIGEQFTGRPLIRIMFNAALNTLGSVLALVPFYALVRFDHLASWQTLVGFGLAVMIIVLVTHTGTVLARVLSSSGASVLDLFRPPTSVMQLLQMVLSLAILVIIFALLTTAPILILFLSVPAAFLVWAFQLSGLAAHRQYILQQLLGASSLLQGATDMKVGSIAFLDCCRRILRMDFAELILFTAEDFVLDTVVEATNSLAMQRVAVAPYTALRTEVVDRTAVRLRPDLLSPRLANRPERAHGFAAAVFSDDKQLGILLLAERPARLGKVKREDGEILVSLAEELGVALRNGQLQDEMDTMSGVTAELNRRVLTDALTGLSNRTSLSDRLEQALARAKRSGNLVGLLFLDLDGFKQVNDTLGHQSGDALLVGVAERLRTLMRETDTVARFAGDEFVILLEAPSDEDAAALVAERVVACLRAPFTLAGDKQAQVGCSVGLACTRAGVSTPTALMQRADSAMYEAKRAGKGRVVRALSETA